MASYARHQCTAECGVGSKAVNVCVCVCGGGVSVCLGAIALGCKRKTCSAALLSGPYLGHGGLGILCGFCFVFVLNCGSCENCASTAMR